MKRKKKFKALLAQRRSPLYQVREVNDQSRGGAHGRAMAVTDESNQVASLELMTVDENLLDRARTQWQFGDWESLRQIDRDSLHLHPDRAKLALLAAAGHYHSQDNNAARQLIRMAQAWGCSKKLISQVLISGVHNTLGRAVAVTGNMTRAIEHFEAAVDAGAPKSDRLIKQVRTAMQLQQLGVAAPLGLIGNGNSPLD